MTRACHFRGQRILPLLLLVVCVLPAFGGTINVPGDQPTIQAAIDVALDGQTVVVAPGLYSEALDFLGKAITVRASDGPASTIIDGGQNTSAVTFASGEGPDSVLEGFTVTNGAGTEMSCIPAGCLRFGGGILCDGASPTIQGNVIVENSAEGIAISMGGGIAVIGGGAPAILGNEIRDNSCLAGGGGGIACSGSSPVIQDNIIVDNEASSGGGVFCFNASPILVNNVVVMNSALGGGGLWVVIGSEPQIESCTIADNIASSDGGGLFVGDTAGATVINTIVWGNDAAMGDQIESSSPDLFVTFSDVQGGWPGTGNIDADPLFVGPTDYHLTATSPCIDVGTDTAPQLPASDFEGDPRIWCITIDMGADESPPGPACPVEFVRGDANGDGGINMADPIFNLYTLAALVTPICLDAQDTNDDGSVDMADPVFSLTFQFGAGATPASPYPGCGVDPTPDVLDCGTFPLCP